jgi:hypothetical protein
MSPLRSFDEHPFLGCPGIPGHNLVISYALGTYKIFIEIFVIET